ncbi:MAG: AraC family transcriptional regulator [Nevskiaceae bacterium]|nr:MAG: AraC family transcriptional regulator [Nevskiaceae bacterium]TBR74838.1 MAG: AraC family transcriptional regulator [Nevskiaceae bacterium]
MRDSGQMMMMVHRGMLAAGIDVDAVYERLGYHAQQLELRNLRTPHAQQLLFWNCLEGVTGDPDIGLHLCRHLPHYRGEILEYLVLSSRTFGDGLARASKYVRLLSDAIEIRLETGADTACLKIRTSALGDAPQARHTEICVVYQMMRFAASVTEHRATAQRLSLHYPRHAPQAEYDTLFQCPVTFGTPDAEIHFNPAILGWRSPHWDPDLLKLNEELANRRMAGLERQDLVHRIRALFAQRLELERCELDDIAAELGMPARRLRFELSRAGTTFSQLLNEFRFALSKRLLGTTGERIENIAYLTGFSEPSTFYRAFKRWSGKTPVQYREDQQAEADK